MNSEPEKQQKAVQENRNESRSESGKIPAKTPAGGAGNVERFKNADSEKANGKAIKKAVNVPENKAEQAETLQGGKNSAMLKKVSLGMERLLSAETLDLAKLDSVVKKLTSPELGLDIPAGAWVKWGKLARQRGAYEIAALLLEKAAGEL